MKKVLLSVLAVGMLTACSQDETVDMQAPSQIAFAGAFVNNVTRAAAEDAADPSTTTANIDQFNVWGYVKNSTGTVFNNVPVTKSGNAWTYSPLQYWTPGNTYRFFALTPNNEYKGQLTAEDGAYENGLGTITFINNDGTEDLLYASKEVKTTNPITDVEAVKFEFDHLLSKVKFTFKNGFSTGYSKLIVKNIRMYVPSVGTLTLPLEQPALGGYAWNLGEEKEEVVAPEDAARAITDEGTELDFDDILGGAQLAEGASGASDNERLTIPAERGVQYKVLFDAVLYQDQVVAMEVTDQEATISGVELKSGYAYNFVAVLDASNFGGGLKPIEFDALVDEWVNAGDFNLAQNVTTEDELIAAVENGGEVSLSNDIELTKSLAIEKNVNLNLNGKKLTIANDSEELGEGDGIIVTAGNLTINGEGTVEANTRAIWARGNGGAKITINGGTYVGSKTGSEVIYASGNGQITINSGTFEATVQDEVSFAAPQYAVLNLHGNGATGNNIIVYGGSFKKFNPSDNVSENPKKDFVAPGYKSVANGDYFDVVAE